MEPALAVENEGEFPTMTDQGEGQQVPKWPKQEKEKQKQKQPKQQRKGKR